MKRSLRSWLWRVPLDQEVDDEIAFHIEMRTRELVERGLDPRVARETVLSRIGDLGHLKRTCIDLGRKREREMRITHFIENLRDDVRFAIRQLVKSPGFTIVAAITLALGIGANSAIVALAEATLLRPLPFRDADRLVVAWERTDSTARGNVSPLNVVDWSERSRTIERFAGLISGLGGGMVMSLPDGTSDTIPRQWVTEGFFDVLGIKPIAGRLFLPTDETRRPNVAVISEGVWRTRFAADPGLIGRQVRLDGAPYTVIGIAPGDFQFNGPKGIWALFPSVRGIAAARAPRFLQVIARLKPGVSLTSASTDMTGVAESIGRDFPATNTGRGIMLEPMRDVLIGSELRLTSFFFLAVVGFVLLICCANVANLLLARATVRGRELAIRSALGAGRRRIVRQLLTESLVLAMLGGVLGIGVGAAILNVAPAMIPQGLLPGEVTLSFDMSVVAFCAAAALFVGLLFGLAPAWHAPALASAQTIASDSRTTTGRGQRVRGLLVVGEVAAAVLLLFGAGLLLRTLLALDHVDRGYKAESLLTMMVDPLGSSYPTPETLQQFYDAVEHEVRTLPGVRNVAWATTLPLGDSQLGAASFEIVGDPPVDESRLPSADYQLVSASYFGTLDLPITAGRNFSDRDTRTSVPVCIVNEAFVRTLRGRSPIGMRVAIHAGGPGETRTIVKEIVGVARQIKGRPDETQDLLQIYVPTTQRLVDDIYMIVRPTSGRAEALAGSVRAAIRRIDKEQLVSVRDIMTLDDIARGATARHRFRAVMVTTFAGLALLLAMIGVFGILAYSVQQRMREFGVRIALGATTRDVLRMVLGSAARLIVVGAVIGLAAAALLSRSIATFLFGVQPLDPATFVSVGIVLTLTAALATLAPALRAARIDPVEAFRSE